MPLLRTTIRKIFEVTKAVPGEEGKMCFLSQNGCGWRYSNCLERPSQLYLSITRCPLKYMSIAETWTCETQPGTSAVTVGFFRGVTQTFFKLYRHYEVKPDT